jgi:hypothetical protein
MLSSLSPRIYSHCSSLSLSRSLCIAVCITLIICTYREVHILLLDYLLAYPLPTLSNLRILQSERGSVARLSVRDYTHPAHSAGETGKVLSQYRCVCVLSTFRVHLFTRFFLSSPFYFEPIRSSARRRHPFPRNRRAKLDPQSRQLLIQSRKFSDPHSTCPKLLPPTFIFFV